MVLLALLSSCAVAYAARARQRERELHGRVAQAQRRESDVLEAARVLAAASRDSTQAVFAALDGALRVFEPQLDAVLAFVPCAEELTCAYASGARSAHFDGTRVPRDRAGCAIALASRCGHHVVADLSARALIPTDRAAIAVPMLAGDALVAVIYASSTQGMPNADALVRGVAQAAAPYALAAEREADRASATFDALTGLYTPRAFREQLQRELALAHTPAAAPLALWFVDTDRFKSVNDTYGHAAGDAVLRAMAALLREHTVAGVDLAARNGGDEFCAVVRGTHKLAAIERAQRFCNAVRAANFGPGIPVTASVGVAAFPSDAANANELLEVADAAMYHSKRCGRDRVSFAAAGAFSVYE